jgi:MFS family permease
MRFVLGAAEAGFYPGVILYLSAWFPGAERAKVFGWFTLANPIAAVLGGPLSGAILTHASWLGVRSWQVLFLVEGFPAVVLGWVVWRFLDDRPRDARWLSAAERALIERRVAADAEKRADKEKLSLWQGLRNPRVLLLGAVYFGCIAGNYGLSFWLPQIVKAFGVTNFQTGLIAAIPYACGAIAMVLWSAHSDRTGERAWHVTLPLLLAGGSLLASSRMGNPVWTMVLMCLAGMGIFANTPPFWTWPTSLMGGLAAAGGVALVNSLGNLSGFFAPYLIGAIKRRTGGFQWGLAALSTLPLLSAALMWFITRAARSRS